MSGATRGAVTAARVQGGRVLLDVQLRSGEVRSRVELMLLTGVTAIPRAGADVLVVQAGPSRDHLVAVVADTPAQRAEGLEAGDIAVRDSRGQQVLLLADRIEISGAPKIVLTSSAEVVVTAPVVKLGSAGAAKRVKLEDNSNATKVFAE